MDAMEYDEEHVQSDDGCWKHWSEPWRAVYCREKNIERKWDIRYWNDSFIYLRTDEDVLAMRDEYIGHHFDFFCISQIAQAARDGMIPHEDVTKAVLLMIGVDEDPGDTEVPSDWDGKTTLW